MRIFAVSSVVVLLAGAALPAHAQVTQSYQYDGNGRLTGVTTSGAAGTNSAAYAYDRANNRTFRGQGGSTVWAAITRLPTDQLLQPDEALVSPDGRYSFALRPSGQLELWSGEALATSDSQALVAAFDLTADGRARFMPSLPEAPPSEGVWLALRDDGDLALFDQAGDEVWRSGEATTQEAGQ